MSVTLRKMGYKVDKKPKNLDRERMVYEDDTVIGGLDRYNVFRTAPIKDLLSFEITREDEALKDVIGDVVGKDDLEVEFFYPKGGDTPQLVIKAEPKKKYMSKAIEWYKFLSDSKIESAFSTIAHNELENAKESIKSKIEYYIKQNPRL